MLISCLQPLVVDVHACGTLDVYVVRNAMHLDHRHMVDATVDALNFQPCVDPSNPIDVQPSRCCLIFCFKC